MRRREGPRLSLPFLWPRLRRRRPSCGFPWGQSLARVEEATEGTAKFRCGCERSRDAGLKLRLALRPRLSRKEKQTQACWSLVPGLPSLLNQGPQTFASVQRSGFSLDPTSPASARKPAHRVLPLQRHHRQGRKTLIILARAALWQWLLKASAAKPGGFGRCALENKADAWTPSAPSRSFVSGT